MSILLYKTINRISKKLIESEEVSNGLGNTGKNIL